MRTQAAVWLGLALVAGPSAPARCGPATVHQKDVMIHRILLATTVRDPRQTPMTMATALARRFGAELHILAVVRQRGHTVFERWLIGSVARQVIACAHCAVTMVRKPCAER
jgi:nucleotide-binding universal stress UspA family protein